MEAIGKMMPTIRMEGMELCSETPEERAQRKADDYNATEGSLNQEDGYDCPICKNKGHVAFIGEKDAFGWPAEYFKPCKCCKVRNAIRRLNRSGLKNVVKEMTFDKYEARDSWQQAIKDTAQRFCQANDGSWFFIGGQSGAGKTHICTAIAVHYIRQGKEVRYMVWPKEIQTIQALVNDADKYASLMKDIQEADVLYIDDLFKHGKDEHGNVKAPTAPEVRRAFEIINHRYNNPGLVTIISSERTLFDLDNIDEAVAGRIAQRSKPGGYCITLKPDKRKNWRMQGVMEL
jgi:DNA replication protein DnaC